MADQKLTQLTALASLSADDLFYVVDDPAGAALSRKMAASVLDSRYLQSANDLSDLASAAAARSNLSLVIGTNVQAWDADLDTIAGLAKADGNFIVGDGAAWVVESGATARTSLGLGSLAVLNSPLPIANGGSGQTTQQAAIDALTAVSGATDEYVLTKDTVSGNAIFKVSGSGTTLPVADTQTIVKGSADVTKLFRIEVDGFTAGATRVMTPPNQDFLAAGQNVANVFTVAQTITPAADAANIFRVNKANGDRAFTVDTNAVRIGIYTEPFANGIDADVQEFKWGTPRTSNTDKEARLTMIPYGGTSAIGLFGGSSAASGTSVNFGGGNGAAYAVTQCRFYTAADITTLFGDIGMVLTQVGLKIALGDFVGALAQLHVIQNDTSGLKSVLELEQLDLSEEIIQFDGTVATGNPIEAIGAKTFTPTHLIRCSVNGSFGYLLFGSAA